MTPSEKCLPCKRENLNVDPQNLFKRLGTVAFAHNLSVDDRVELRREGAPSKQRKNTGRQPLVSPASLSTWKDLGHTGE